MSRGRFPLLIALGLGLAPACAGPHPHEPLDPRPHARWHLERGQGRIRGNRPVKALADFREAVALDPDLPEAQAALFGLFRGQRWYTDGMRHFDAAVLRRPEDARLRLYRAVLAWRAGRLDRARADYARARRLDPDLRAAVEGLIHLELEAGRPGRAWRLAREGLARWPDHLGLRYQVGECHLRMGEWAEAEALFRAILEERPGDAPARHGLGQAYFYGGDLEAAGAVFEALAQDVPGHELVHYELSRVYLRQGRIDAARKERDVIRRLRRR